MNIYIGADHKGVVLKGKIKEWLNKAGHSVTDVGAETVQDEDDYPDYARSVAQGVQQDPEGHKGILICGSGAGMAVAANKFKGVRAALLHDPVMAKDARDDDDINVLVLGADYIDEASAHRVVEAWLNTPFSGEERHARRLSKIKAIEADVCK